MRIASKLNFAILFVFATSALANYAVMNSTVQPKFDEIDLANAKVNHERVSDALRSFAEKLRTASQDYSFWNDSYDFVRGKNKARFIESNLTPVVTALGSLEIDALVFRKLDGSIVWGAATDSTRKVLLPELSSELGKVPYRHPHLDGAEEMKAHTGVIATSEGFFLISVAPVLRSDQSGPPVGTVLAGARVDNEALKALTQLDFQLSPLAASEVIASMAVSMLPSIEIVEVSSPLNDIMGRPIAKLKVYTPRSVRNAGSQAIQMAILQMLAVAAAVISVLWLIVHLVIVSRLDALRKHIATAGKTGEIAAYPSVASSDEIGELSRSFNGMANEVNHLRDALADHSYLSGMSEWAATTLHNIRNQLAPISTLTWQIDRLFDVAWLENLKSAQAQLASQDTEEAHRNKLNDYVVAAVSRMVDSGQKARELANRIDSTNKAVVGAVSEFEQYTRSEAKREPVDLMALLTDAAANLSLKDTSKVAIELPQATATVMGDRLILRQIVTNLLGFAHDEAAGSTSGSIVRIVLALEANNRIVLTLFDNGRGRSADELKSMFQSSAEATGSKRHGLGLHWCANALAQLKGTISARSKGPGTGTALVVRLPAEVTTKKEAA